MEASGAIPFTMSDLGAIMLSVSERARIGFAITAVREGIAEGIYISDSAVRIFGHPREELMNKNLIHLCVPEERRKVEALVQRIVNREPIDPFLETTIVQENGNRVDIDCAIVDVVHGGRTLTVNIITDATDRRRLARVIAASNERFRHLIEAVPDAIFVIDPKNVVVYANRSAARLLGHEEPGELLGRAAPAWVERNGAAKEYRVRRNDGSDLILECTSLQIDYEDAPSVVIFARDVTERRRMQEQLARTDRLAALGALAAGVAHEINNPLAFMTLNVEALERLVTNAVSDPALRKKVLDVVGEVRSGADRVAGIVRDLRMFSRADDVEESAVDLVSVIASAQRLVAHELRLRTHVVVELPDLPAVKASPSRLEQVFVNLLLNAAQAFESSSEKNAVRITGGVLANGSVHVDIADNGPGIPADILGRIFDPFFTTKPRGVGTGVGLSICHGIVARLGGELTVSSEVGRGTTLRVTLLPQRASTPPAVAAEGSTPFLGRGRILVVDDEPAICQSLRALLEEDHHVDVVTSGEQAIHRMLEGEPYDVVFCDVTMREVGGAEVYDRIAQARPGLEGRLVFMTGGATTESARAFLARVPNIRIEKPFSVVVLHRALRAVIGR
jgi:PAS domain S-box-containing protein